MSVKVSIKIDGKEIQRVEGEHKEKKEVSEAFKRIKRFLSRHKHTEVDQTSYSVELLLAGWDEILKATPVKRTKDVVAQAGVAFTTILGRRVLLEDLRPQVDEALTKFRETRSSEDFFKFRALFDQYQSLISNHYRELKYILAKIKIPSTSEAGLDFRYLLRTRSKLISRNASDEDSFSVKKTQVLRHPFFTLKNFKNENRIYKSYNQQLGSFLQ